MGFGFPADVCPRIAPRPPGTPRLYHLLGLGAPAAAWLPPRSTPPRHHRGYTTCWAPLGIVYYIWGKSKVKKWVFGPKAISH